MYLITDPLNLTVKLKGEAKDAQSSRAGFYFLGPNEINGKSHWLQNPGTNAIWYEKNVKHWIIGRQDEIGSGKGYITTSEDVPGPQEAKEWKYLHNDTWTTYGDDILVDTFEPGT